jgi:hypothetical protein
LNADTQKMLLENIAATVRFVLDPKDPGRIAQLQVVRDFLKQNPEAGPFHDKPAERVDFTDLYHGHVCLPQPILDNKAEVQKLGAAVAARQSALEADIQSAIGLAMPTTRGESKKVMAAVGKNRQPFLDALAPLLQALAGVPEAGVLYHSWEHDKPKVGGKPLDVRSSPVRRIFTPFSTHRPEFQLKEAPHCFPLANFSFHVDQSGRITLLPGASSEMVRAFEILHDALVPMATQPSAPPAATTIKAPRGPGWSISAEAGGDVTPDAQRLAFALGGRVSLKADELVVFNPMLGFNLLYLPSSSFNASHVLAATTELGARVQQRFSGFYFDVSAGGYAGFDIDPERETTTEITGGLTGAAGVGWRFQHLDVGAEARALVPEADFDRTNVLVFGRAAWRFGESGKRK